MITQKDAAICGPIGERLFRHAFPEGAQEEELEKLPHQWAKTLLEAIRRDTECQK